MPEPKLTCSAIQQQIDELSRNELRQIDAQHAIKAHVAQCENCRAYLQEIRALAEKLDCWQAPAPSRNIALDVMSGIAQLEREWRDQAAAGDWLSKLLRVINRPLQVPAYALLLLILLLSGSLWLNLDGGMLKPQDTRLRTPEIADSTQTSNGARTVLIETPQSATPVPVQYLSSHELNTRIPGQYSTIAPSAILVIIGTPLIAPEQNLFLSAGNGANI